MKIAPVKEEEVFLEPRLVLYHDVITDNELDVVKKLATPRVSLQKLCFNIVGFSIYDNYHFLFHSNTICGIILKLSVQACDRAELQDGRIGDGFLPHLEDGLVEARGGEAGGQHLSKGARHHGAQHGDVGGTASFQLWHGRTLRAAF